MIRDVIHSLIRLMKSGVTDEGLCALNSKEHREGERWAFCLLRGGTAIPEGYQAEVWFLDTCLGISIFRTKGATRRNAVKRTVEGLIRLQYKIDDKAKRGKT